MVDDWSTFSPPNVPPPEIDIRPYDQGLIKPLVSLNKAEKKKHLISGGYVREG